MIADLKPYAEYKESGSPWLGKIPVRWELPRLGSVLCERKETNEKREIEQVLSVMKGIGVIRYEDKGNVGNKRSEDTRRYKIVRPDDIVVNCMNVIIGSVGRSRYFGCLSPVYYVLTRRAEADNPRYLAAVFATRSFHESLVRIGNGILAHRMRIPMELLKCEPFPIPPSDEQAAIVRFLDWANGRLDRAIRAKRKVIARLNEQKQAIIYRAVTFGLDPLVSLNTDGPLFLQSRPSHWPLVRAKYLLRQVVPPIPEDAEMVTCFRDGQVTLRRNRRTTGFTNAIWELGYQGIEPGQLVLHSMDAFAGAIGVSDSSGKCSPEYIICEPAMEGIVAEYYGFLLRSLALRGLFVALCSSVRERAPRVRFNDFGAFKLPKPPFSEQQKIAEFIHDACISIDKSLATMRQEADLLQEYRARLVADLVTGKLDVRDAAAKLSVEEQTIEPGEELVDETSEASEDEIAEPVA